KDSNICRGKNRLRRVAQQLCCIDDFKDSQNGRQDRKRYADDANDGCQGCERSNNAPEEIDNAAGKSHPRNDIYERRVLLICESRFHLFLLNCRVPQCGRVTFIYASLGEWLQKRSLRISQAPFSEHKGI